MARTEERVSQEVDLQEEQIRDDVSTFFKENWNPDLTLKEWWRILGDSGWAVPTWPKDWFGRGLSSRLARVVADERRKAGALGPPSGIGIMMAGPTIVEHGTEEQKQHFIPPMVYGEEVWCQLFSEPGAGSDLASLQTKAIRDGDEWIVNGQKVWTSGAQFSKWGILVARTNVDVPKHEGITFFVIDIDQPGVEVRPLKEMTGGATFNEVFFNDARVPHENVIGDVDRGWSVALTTLAHERTSLGAGSTNSTGGGELIGRADLSQRVGDLVGGGGGGMGGLFGAFGAAGLKMLGQMAQGMGRANDPIFRQRLAYLYTLLEIARYTGIRSQARAARGEGPGPEASIGKLVASEIMRSARDTMLSLVGSGGLLQGKDAPMGGVAQQVLLFGPAVSIAGGTDEVQRNVIGERVLGLPPEPRVDKDIPFRELKTGTL